MTAAARRTLPVPARLLLFASVPPALIGIGTVGYRLTERWSWFDAFYVAVITLTSIGYGDKHAFSTAGRLLTLALALGGISTIAVAATELLGTVITGELREWLGSWRMTKRIDRLEGHVIVCGYGHVGSHVCADLRGSGVAVVAIDRRAEPVAAALAAGLHVVPGDASDDRVLRQAGLGRARALVAAAGSDPDNVLITMSARLLAARVPIVSRVEAAATAPKLLRAGATRTACPDAIAGGRMADAVLRPAATEAALQMTEQMIAPGSRLDGRTIGECGLRPSGGPILIAVKRPDGRLAFNPDDGAIVAAGDTLIMLARRDEAPPSDERASER